jgi:ectoine hydroxylase-related dioxygenase (phytanoyl-CoA dioxygenase family)
VQYVQGSHRWGKLYAPRTFGQNTGFGTMYAKSGFEEIPPEAALLNGHRILKWETEPGDVIVHHPRTCTFPRQRAQATCAAALWRCVNWAMKTS